MDRRSFLFGSACVVLACRQTEPTGGTRVVSLGGGLTEILFALGIEADIVGVDSSSYFPEAAQRLPQVGYQRRISAEGVIGLAPTLVVHSDAAGPSEALDQIRAAGIETAQFEDPWDLDGARARLRAIAAKLERVAQGDQLIAQLDTEIGTLERLRAAASTTPKVMFIYARGADTLMVAGRRTAATTMIELSGARNAFEHDDFKPISAESAIVAAPEILLVTERGLASVGGQTGLLAQPGLAETPAGRSKRVIAVDDLALLGFGPRTGQTLLDMTRSLHPELV
jgi:iron complex transport system substrate-binding protein